MVQTILTLDAVYVAWLLRYAGVEDGREHELAAGFMSVMEQNHVVDWLKGGKVGIGLHRLLVRISFFLLDFLLLLRVFSDKAAVSTTPPGTPPRTAGCN